MTVTKDDVEPPVVTLFSGSRDSRRHMPQRIAKKVYAQNIGVLVDTPLGLNEGVTESEHVCWDANLRFGDSRQPTRTLRKPPA